MHDVLRSKRLALGACLLVWPIALVAAQGAASIPPYPASDTYDLYVQYVHRVMASSQANSNDYYDWEPFDGLMKAGRYEGVFLLARAMHETAPQLSYCLGGIDFRNPVNLAYEAGQLDLVKRLIGLDRALARMPDQSAEATYLDPLATAVTNNDERWAQAFLDAGASIDTDHVASTRHGGYPANLLTVSPSKEMDAFLLSKHISTIHTLDSPQDGSCASDNVRLRSDPGLQGKVLGKLMTGDAFSVLATTYKRQTIDSVDGCWVKVSFKGQTGWVFQPFVRCDYFDMP